MTAGIEELLPEKLLLLNAARAPRFKLLRVTASIVRDVAELRIDGCITGDAAIELWAECHKQSTAGKRLRLDLAGVTLVDDAAVVRIKRLVRQGAEIANASLLVSALLANWGITRKIPKKRRML